MDQTKVTSGFDLELAIGGRYLANLLLLASDVNAHWRDPSLVQHRPV